MRTNRPLSVLDQLKLRQSRRVFLSGSANGIGALALAALLNPPARAAGSSAAARGERWRGVVSPPHVPPKARRVIYLCMAGGPSHLETFDSKPKLAELHGKPMPESFTAGQQIAQLQGQKLNCFGPQYPFAKYGHSGQEISSIFPHLAQVADDLCIIRSMQTEQINHDPAHTFMNTGSGIAGRPSMGSWVFYGLGSDCEDLPGFVVLTSTGKYGQAQPIAARQWASGFLPTRFQGVHFRSQGDAVHYLHPPAGVTAADQAQVLRAVNDLNQLRSETLDDPELATRISQYEMAFRMQTSVPGLMDLSKEPAKTLALYGTRGADGSFAANCLLARRLAERGVRFIQLYHRDWDHHGAVKEHIKGTAAEVDQACYALLTDLKERGMFEDTLIVWAGEFGRTPMAQGDGRDHHIKGFSIWMAGGGVSRGLTYGATDELGYNAVENIVSVHDLHATMLHLLGIDHLRLTFFHQGREYRLTDVSGSVVKGILA
jgi:hypothetical protein